jgi:hypothetical protein
MTKLFAAILLVGGLLLAADAIAYEAFWGAHKPTASQLESPLWFNVGLLELAGSAGVTLGFVALLGRAREKDANLFREIGVGAAIVGGMFEHAIAWIQVFVRPYLATLDPTLSAPPAALQGMFMTASVMLTLGLIVLGAACFQAGLPKVPSVLLVMAGVFAIVAPPGIELNPLVLAVAAIWLGVFLARSPERGALGDPSSGADRAEA